MSSNYSSDPNNAASLSNPVTPQSDKVLPSVAPLSLSASSSSAVEPVSPGSGGSGGSQRRLASGTILSTGRYKIEKSVAAGGMGAVYRAIDTRFNRPCAVKEMLDEFQSDNERTQAVEWFGREATLLLDLNHPCIPRVRDFFVEGGKHYLVMDFIEGKTLGEVLEKEGNVVGVNGTRGVPEARARSWAQQLCSVLSYLHRQTPPIIFRDLKPSNIMVTDNNEVKLIDFGIARTFQTQRQSTIIMTIGYAPPEQLHGMPEPRSDIYALGATLHRILTHHDAANNKPSIFSFPPVRMLRPDVSIAFDQVIMKALFPTLEQRWLNAGEMEKAIINLPPISVVPPTGSFPLPVQQFTQRPANPQTPNNSITPNNPSRNTTTGPGQIFARRKPPEIDRAMQAYNRSLQLNPNDAETHKLIGDVFLFLRRQPLQGIPAYTQSLRLNPNDTESHQRLAQCYEETNQLEPALREYQEAARLAPKLALLHQKVGQIAWRLNQLPIAERAFVTVLTLNPADHQTRFLLSQVYESEGKLIDAERECSYIVSMIPAAQQVLLRIRSRLGR